MKAKYLFYSLALASAFTACSQEELFDAPALDSNEVAGRPVAGVVTFVNDEVDSRYNRQNATFEKGDKMGIYLMDTFNGFEAMDANETHWNYQSSWWAMYRMDNNIHTNYGYVYDGNNTWVNRASQLNEGNYIAMFPQNELATNRRDLWHAIDGNVDLVAHTDKERYYVNRDNQFFLGYEQIMRDQKPGSENGELKANISMKPILTYAKFGLENDGADNFKPKKLVFKLKGGMPLPNVAYVKPALITAVDNTANLGIKIEVDGNKYDRDFVAAPWWALYDEDKTALKEGVIDDCKNLLAWSKYDRNTYDIQAARSMVQYASTVTGIIPYGMTEEQAAPIYEYVFNFPADEDLILYGTRSDEGKIDGNCICWVSIALPAFGFADPESDNGKSQRKHMQDNYSYYWKDMEVIVYGEKYDQLAGEYRPGIIRMLDQNDNANFGLNQMALWEGGNYIPESVVKFDDHYFTQTEEVRVSNTEDLITLLNARLSDPQTAIKDGKIKFEVMPYGDMLEITDEVVKVITDYETEKNGLVDVMVAFKPWGSITTPNIVLKAENCIDEFIYSGVNVVVEAPQTIQDVVIEDIINLTNNSILTIKKVSDDTELNVDGFLLNEKGATINVEKATVEATYVTNHGTITLKNANLNAEIEVKNEGVLTSNGNTEINADNVLNLNQCNNCGGDKAELTVETGKLTINGTLKNYDNVTVKAGATLEATIENDKFDNNHKGYINVIGKIIVKGESSNAHEIDVQATGEVRVEYPEVLKNTGTIDVYGELVENIKNDGLINVIDNGHVIVNGNINGTGKNGIIDVTKAADDNKAHAAKDKAPYTNQNYFRYTVNDETTSGKLQKSLKARISSANWGLNKNPIILVWSTNSASSYYGTMSEANVERIIVENDLVITKSSSTTLTKFDQLNDYDWTNAEEKEGKASNKALHVKENATLTVENGVTFEVSEGADGADGTLHVCIEGKFMAKNHSTVNTGNVEVEGNGTVEIDTDVTTFAWKKATTGWNGNWDGGE